MKKESVLAALLQELRGKNGKRPCDCTSCDCGNSGDTYSVGNWDGADWILSQIEGHLSAGSNERPNEHPVEREWISCSERLPENYNRVLAYSPDRGTRYASFSHPEGFQDMDAVYNPIWGRSLQGVTKWMPLPEPPREAVKRRIARHPANYLARLK